MSRCHCLILDGEIIRCYGSGYSGYYEALNDLYSFDNLDVTIVNIEGDCVLSTEEYKAVPIIPKPDKGILWNYEQD